jgi:hypothetical protein
MIICYLQLKEYFHCTNVEASLSYLPINNSVITDASVTAIILVEIRVFSLADELM